MNNSINQGNNFDKQPVRRHPAHHKHKNRPFSISTALILLTLTSLASCSNLPSNISSTPIKKGMLVVGSTAPEESSTGIKQLLAERSKLMPPAEITLPPSDLEAETLYDLIVAEMASKENRLDVTLGNYLKQAHYTRDPNIIARATRVAKYIGANQATLDAATLWLEVEPDNTEALQAVTIQLLRLEKYDEALKQMDKLLLQSDNPNFDFLIRQSKNVDKETRANIITGLNSLAIKFPSNARLWFTKAIMEEQQGEKSTALTSAQHSIEIDPSYVAAKIFTAKTQQALDLHEDALKTLKHAVKKHSEHKRLRIIYARLLIKQNKLKKAQEQFEYLIKKNPHDSDLILSLALLSWENKLDKQAKKYLNRLINNSQKVDDAHTYLGQIYASEKRYKKAIEHYQQVKNGPSFTAARIQQALMYGALKNPQKAIELLHQASIERPKSKTQFIVTESEILIEDKRLDEAYTLLDKALADTPQDASLLYSRAMLAEKMNNLEQLENDLRSIIAADPNSALALNALGYTLADRSERLEEALELINKAAIIEPDDPAIIDSLGWVYYKLGNQKMALQHLRKAYKLYGDHEIAAHLGEALWTNGQQAEAESIWKSSAVKYPDSPILKKVMDQYLK